MAAEMLEVPVPESPPDSALDPAVRAVLEDRLAHAGLGVFAPGGRSGDILKDGDLNP